MPVRIWADECHPESTVGEYTWQWCPDSTTYMREDIHAAALAEKDTEIERLEAWKREAIAVFESAKLHEVGKALDVPLGGCIASAILPGIESLKEDLAAERAKVRELVECLSDVLRLPSSDMGNYQLGPGIPDWLRDEIKPLIEKYKEEPNA